MSSVSKVKAILVGTTDVKEEFNHDEASVGLFKLKFRTVVFEAGGKRFRVPWYGEPGIAAAFQAKFFIENDTGDAHGSSADNPIRLEGVSDTDFASLLKATYPPPGHNSATALSFDEWMSVLKLSKKWDLAMTREHAVAGSDAIVQTKEPLQKVLLGKKYGVVKWLEEGYRALILRWEGLSEEERKALDASTQLKILHLRDKAWEGLLRSAWGRHDDANRSKKQTRALGGESEQTAAIREVFGHELKSEQ
ncbi:unnamed protein product [Peniophora sp. CBMAI 1063]|nr:unnamed protein product [Peniophora sp. CBMAI 1063]